MADTKISALTAVSAMQDATELPVNEAGTTKKVSGTLLKAYFGDSLRCASVTDQTISATTAYVTDSNMAVPVGKVRIRTVWRWRISVTKSAAGTTAGCAVLVKLGTNGSNADATVLTLTFGTPTGVVDNAVIEVEVVSRGPLSASGILQGWARLTHNLSATGFSTLPCEVVVATSGSVDLTVANLIAGLSITTSTASAWTIKSIVGEAEAL